ncbi:caspase recruitment domain-containing protein 19-like [Girardinichthys multiradiatus]|uniref:caspase recruitment domain-containing protein 19-like n=1 Tax=Girardinichthys multiradiatus TaxID=208333 RepID=UPI001FAB83D3|nr:caspase recruitment domain-containing protein 19-like [Girardinichthys multiradiatus]
MAQLTLKDTEGYDEQLHSDAEFLCSHQRMDTELVDRLVLQLNRIYPQTLSDKEACKFRSLRVPTKLRLSELLKYLHGKGDDACYEFYRALHIHAEDVYFSLPTRIRQREMPDSRSTIIPDRFELNDRGPIFFLSCFSFAVGIAILYYYRESQRLRCIEAFLHCSAVKLSKDAKDIFISYVEVRKQK